MIVPHFFQSNEATCGPTSLRMLLAALGTQYDEAIIAQACAITPYGCGVQDLIDAAQILGFNAALLPVAAEQDAIASLSNQAPFVAMIDLASLHGGPMFQWHFVTPLGLSQGEVLFHDPADGPDCRAALV